MLLALFFIDEIANATKFVIMCSIIHLQKLDGLQAHIFWFLEIQLKACKDLTKGEHVSVIGI